jgi:hypothetical protein
VIDSLIIRWPSKITDVYTHVRVNQLINVVEGQNLTAIAEKNIERPSTFTLHQNYPNPFNPSTMIHYALAQAGYVSLKILNLAGQEVATLINGKQNVGEHQIQWQAQGVPSGVYFYQLRVGGHVETRKMILMRRATASFAKSFLLQTPKDQIRFIFNKNLIAHYHRMRPSLALGNRVFGNGFISFSAHFCNDEIGFVIQKKKKVTGSENRRIVALPPLACPQSRAGFGIQAKEMAAAMMRHSEE